MIPHDSPNHPHLHMAAIYVLYFIYCYPFLIPSILVSIPSILLCVIIDFSSDVEVATFPLDRLCGGPWGISTNGIRLIARLPLSAPIAVARCACRDVTDCFKLRVVQKPDITSQFH